MVLLLIVKNGAEGLTLVEATHIFMVEPLHEIEDAIRDARRKHDIAGGGIDGGFSQGELQELLKA